MAPYLFLFWWKIYVVVITIQIFPNLEQQQPQKSKLVFVFSSPADAMKEIVLAFLKSSSCNQFT